jgi:cell wall-associated NlpC family hydrolase
MVAGALTEAPARDEFGNLIGANADAEGDYEGGVPQSFGLYQMHSRGLGHGVSVQDRKDPEFATRFMFPPYQAGGRLAVQRGYAPGTEDWAATAYMEAEKPLGYPNIWSKPAMVFRERWRGIAPIGDTMHPVAEQVLQIAPTYAGVPYDLPPNWPDTVDCSLYVLKVFEQAGHPFPAGVRTAEQIRWTCPMVVPWDEVQPGDLLFFERTYDIQERPGPDGYVASHIGISLGAYTQEQWEARVPAVGRYSIASPWWQERLFEARRPAQYLAVPNPEVPPDDQLAYLKSYIDAIFTNVLAPSREQLEAELAKPKRQRDWAVVEEVAANLRAHE